MNVDGVYRELPKEVAWERCAGGGLKVSWWRRLFGARRVAQRLGNSGRAGAAVVVLRPCPVCGEEVEVSLDTHRLDAHPKKYVCACASCAGPSTVFGGPGEDWLRTGGGWFCGICASLSCSTVALHRDVQALKHLVSRIMR